MSVEVNGIAHVQLTVNDPARCVPFWEKLCHFLGMQTLIRGEDVVYCIGGRTGVLVRGAPQGTDGVSFDQNRAGLHHVCFRARNMLCPWGGLFFRNTRHLDRFVMSPPAKPTPFPFGAALPSTHRPGFR